MLQQITCRLLLLSLCAASLFASAGCRATKGAEGETPAEQRSTIKSEEASTLGQLYAARPETQSKIRSAAGYAYFSNMNVNVLLLSTENGYGVAHDNATGKDTFMKMAGGGVGLGMGVKDYRAIFIFTDPSVMHQFVDAGWEFGGQADATAKAEDTGGGAANAAASGNAYNGMEIYQFTKNGLSLQATVAGTKYWRDDSLNK